MFSHLERFYVKCRVHSLAKQIRSAYKKEEKRKLLRVNDRVSSFTFTYISSRIQSPKKKNSNIIENKVNSKDRL